MSPAARGKHMWMASGDDARVRETQESGVRVSWGRRAQISCVRESEREREREILCVCGVCVCVCVCVVPERGAGGGFGIRGLDEHHSVHADHACHATPHTSTP
eukprot:703784-Rhodomonas_salina.3